MNVLRDHRIGTGEMFIQKRCNDTYKMKHPSNAPMGVGWINFRKGGLTFMKSFIRFSLTLMLVCLAGVVFVASNTNAFTINEFTIPTADSEPSGITAGPDGALWFTEEYGNKIGRITPQGDIFITEFPIPTANSGPNGIASGPDGNLWFTEYWADKIGRITTQGVITEFPIPTADSGPLGITSGPDGNLWFTELDGDKIGKITTVWWWILMQMAKYATMCM